MCDNCEKKAVELLKDNPEALRKLEKLKELEAYFQRPDIKPLLEAQLKENVDPILEKGMDGMLNEFEQKFMIKSFLTMMGMLKKVGPLLPLIEAFGVPQVHVVQGGVDDVLARLNGDGDPGQIAFMAPPKKKETVH